VTGPLPVTGSVTIPADELRWRFSRAGGPGGQGVNTTDSRVELTWDLANSKALSDRQKDRAASRLDSRLVDGTVTVVASEHRAQLRNRQAALTRLADLVRTAIAPPAKNRRPTKPSRASQRRRVEGKKHRGQIKRLRKSPDS
jgi:ribosome-associated protein